MLFCRCFLEQLKLLHTCAALKINSHCLCNPRFRAGDQVLQIIIETLNLRNHSLEFPFVVNCPFRPSSDTSSSLPITRAPSQALVRSFEDGTQQKLRLSNSSIAF